MHFMKKFRISESGATLVEYGVALILAILVGGTALSTLAGQTSEQLAEPGEIMEAFNYTG